MRLLVSVRSASEVGAALAGGADIIDAKEPRHGSLGAVSRRTLASITQSVPPECPFSIALGDRTTQAEVEQSISSLELPPRVAPTYLKLGFAAEPSAKVIERLLRAAVTAASEHRSAPRIIAVAYADSSAAGTAPPGEIRGAALRSDCSGVLLDTYSKTGSDLFSWITQGDLAKWISDLRTEGLLAAVAGGLGGHQMAQACSPLPDVIGVRGAACEGGRGGTVRSYRVAALRGVMDQFIGIHSGARRPGGGRLAKSGK
jgi:(5-formylfuran-3-yl)methyl phosphate synthase